MTKLYRTLKALRKGGILLKPYELKEQSGMHRIRFNAYCGAGKYRIVYYHQLVHIICNMHDHALTAWLQRGMRMRETFGGQCSVDHIDRDTMNNSPSNLRLVTQRVNMQNRGWKPEVLPHGKFRARVMRDGVRKTLGTFTTSKEAYDAHDAFVQQEKEHNE